MSINRFMKKETFMAKHYFSKSALALSFLIASTSGYNLVQADITEGSTDTNTANKVISTGITTPQVVELNTDNHSETAIQVDDESKTQNSLSTSNTPNQIAPSVISEIDSSEVVPIEGQTVDIRIASTTDLHTNLVNYDYYQDKPSQNVGLAKTAVLLEEAKKENNNLVIVDNGDLIQGTPLGTYKAIVDPVENGEQHPMYAALEMLGFEASTLGNHEFNYGLDYLKKVLDTADLPVVNANVRDAKTNQLVYTPYIISHKKFTDTNGKQVPVNIGITGIVPPQIMSWDKANLEGKIVVQDAVEAITEVIPEIRKAGADLILVLSHSGIGDDKYEKGEENVGYQIASIPGVDAVVTGHSHAEFPSGNGKGFYGKYSGVDDINGLINGTPVTMAGKYGDHLGIIDLNITYTNGKWAVNKNLSKGSIRKIDTKSEVANQAIINLANEAHKGTIDYVRQQVGTTTAPITSYFALVKDDPSVQIVNKAQLWYANQELATTEYAKLPLLSAAAPFKAGTRNDATAYTDIPAGPIAIKNVADLYLYDNVAAILKITGADLKEWLEMSAGQFNTIDPNKNEPQYLINTDYRTYNFDIIDGVTYEYDITQPNKYDRDGELINPRASRVRNLKYKGQDITDQQEFMVITNNYRANGSFPGVKNASVNYLFNLENRQAIINYILTQKIINPEADNNWYFYDSIKGLDLRFLTAEKAKDLIGNQTDISYLGQASSEGFGEFKFTYVQPAIEQPIKESKEYSQTPNKQKMTSKHRISSQEIHNMVAKAYQTQILDQKVNQSETAQEKEQKIATPTEKLLPKTGDTSSLFTSLFGFSLLSGLLDIKRRRTHK